MWSEKYLWWPGALNPENPLGADIGELMKSAISSGVTSSTRACLYVLISVPVCASESIAHHQHFSNSVVVRFISRQLSAIPETESVGSEDDKPNEAHG